MNAITHVRTSVLRMTQAAFAEVAGVKQATVSRWESGEFDPGLDHLARIRREVIERGQPWDDSWFFEVPAVQTEQAADAAA
jgi:transcriptional regulator with XRE-family HTH domain